MPKELRHRVIRGTIAMMVSITNQSPYNRYPLCVELEEMAKSLILKYPGLKDPVTNHVSFQTILISDNIIIIRSKVAGKKVSALIKLISFILSSLLTDNHTNIYKLYFCKSRSCNITSLEIGHCHRKNKLDRTFLGICFLSVSCSFMFCREKF